jgi:undecaprenyl-diphosphatase
MILAAGGPRVPGFRSPSPMLPSTGFLTRVKRQDTAWSRRLNDFVRVPALRRTMAVASRLGDGLLWYLLMSALVLFGEARLAVRMASTGLLLTGLYRILKTCTARLRPCEEHPGILMHVPPIDRFSFPSGHTMHAVCFTILAMGSIPGTGLLLVPFTLAVMLSRVILGLHYPTDVLAGALLGASAALLSLHLD